jgi:hypothetical protein
MYLSASVNEVAIEVGRLTRRCPACDHIENEKEKEESELHTLPIVSDVG